MGTELNIFLNKKILIYGLGKSGLSAFKFLKNKSDILLYDDLQSNIKALNIKKNLMFLVNSDPDRQVMTQTTKTTNTKKTFCFWLFYCLPAVKTMR